MRFRDCFECGGQCCKHFGIPTVYISSLYKTGVPINIYMTPLNPDPRRYLALHSGVTISNNGMRFTIDKNIRVIEVNGHFVVNSVCTMLDRKGLCTIYDTRPDVCRNFTARTARCFNVPEGCIYETEEVAVK